MAGHGLVKSSVFQTATTDELDKFVKAAGPDLRELFVDMVQRRFEAHTGCYHIPVDYALANAIAAAIEANAFGYKYLGGNVADIPLIGAGQTVEQVRRIGFGKVMYNRDLPEAIKRKGIEAGFKHGYIFANPLTALLFALRNPDAQKEHPLGILFYIGKQLCFLCLDWSDDERILDVRKSGLGSHWSKSVEFLVVPAPAPAAA